jgi:prolyl oligopeptidase
VFELPAIAELKSSLETSTMFRPLRIAFASLTLAASVSVAITPDNLQWLESPKDPAALKWATEQTNTTRATLAAKPLYGQIATELKTTLTEHSPPPVYKLLGSNMIRFRRDAAHTHGLLEIAPRGVDGLPGKWRLALDVDALRRTEGKPYELHWYNQKDSCLAPKFDRCLLMLSPGGGDEVELREFDLNTARFVENGFVTAASRTQAVWLTRDRVLIARGGTNEPLTVAGWPRAVHLWSRGTPLDSAPIVASGEATDAIIQLAAAGGGSTRSGVMIRALDYSTFALSVIDAAGKVSAVELPHALKSFGLLATTDRQLIVQLAQPATIAGKAYPAEAVLAYEVAPIHGAAQRVTLVFAPHDGEVVNDSQRGIIASATQVSLVVDRHLTKRLVAATFDGAVWKTHDELTGVPGTNLTLIASDTAGEDVIVEQGGFITPDRFDLMRPGREPQNLYAEKAAFDASAFTVEIRSVAVADGTSIDYYLLRPKSPAHPGATPTLMTGYGAFGISLAPGYLDNVVGGPAMKLWIERGGALVLPIVRGGGERGDAWHRAAMREKRQVSYDDFLAVARALETSGFTSAQHMGVFGSSNGGLLAATVALQRPDLFGAVVSDVPLIDMLRYPTMGMGGAWMDEYGDPSDPHMQAVLLRYSPFHIIKENTHYPPFFITVSTEDNRVGPGHARKLAARLEQVGAKAYYFEDSEGGHGVSDALQRPELMALRMTFLIDALMQ